APPCRPGPFLHHPSTSPPTLGSRPRVSVPCRRTGQTALPPPPERRRARSGASPPFSCAAAGTVDVPVARHRPSTSFPVAACRLPAPGSRMPDAGCPPLSESSESSLTLHPRERILPEMSEPLSTSSDAPG